MPQDNPTTTPAEPVVAPATATAAEQVPASFAERMAALETENAALKTASEAATQTATQLSEQVATMAKADRAKRFTDTVNGRGGPTDGTRWIGDVEAHVTHMESLAEQFGEDSDQFRHYVTTMTAASEQVKASALFSSYGRPPVPEQGGVAEEVAGKVKALREADKDLTEGEAYKRLFAEDPALYHRYTVATSPHNGGE
jgi:hypothetical protein